jgi:hypothetical protein
MSNHISTVFARAARDFRAQWKRDLSLMGVDADEQEVAENSDKMLCDTYRLAWTRHNEQRQLLAHLKLDYDRELWATECRKHLIVLFTHQGVSGRLAAKIVDEEIIGHSLH